jgi:hypothetical protein
MTPKKKLGQLINRAAKTNFPMPKKDLVSKNPPWYHQKLTEALAEYRSAAHLKTFSIKKEFYRWLTIVDFLTQPRTISEFQQIRKELLATIYYQRPKKIASFLPFLLPKIKIFPEKVIGSLTNKKTTPVKTMKLFLASSSLPHNPYEKIVSLKEACRITKKSSGLVAYSVGKFRDGGHSDQDKLFLGGKTAVGGSGLYLVHVESSTSISERIGQDHLALPDKERAKRIAARQSVDLVLLDEPKKRELNNLGDYYDQLQKQLGFDYWIVGTKDYPWAPTFKEKAFRLGAIFLYSRERKKISATEMIATWMKPWFVNA